PILVDRVLFRGRRLRFRFVVSLLYQVFRAPPNRRFVVRDRGKARFASFAFVRMDLAFEATP
ncbi:hypothetical protein Q8791_21425, partial [Nocardiopsis sp. CT-R113]